jgi:hypothetical protein
LRAPFSLDEFRPVGGVEGKGPLPVEHCDHKSEAGPFCRARIGSPKIEDRPRPRIHRIVAPQQ